MLYFYIYIIHGGLSRANQTSQSWGDAPDSAVIGWQLLSRGPRDKWKDVRDV